MDRNPLFAPIQIYFLSIAMLPGMGFPCSSVIGGVFVKNCEATIAIQLNEADP